MSGPLEGLVVLDLTRYLSGPHCTLLLAGLGAQVIKLDDPAGGDPAALAPPYSGPSFERASAADFGLAYLKRARGKKSATLNLKDPRGRELFLRLAERADVVVENFRPGVAERLGIGYETLKARNPRIVYCALSGYGATGPDRGLKSYDLMAQAESGLMSITGAADGPPMKTGGGWREQLGVVLAVGLRPCSGALIVLAFALSQGLLVAGIVAVLLMGLGTAITTGTLAALAVGAKSVARRLAGADNPVTAAILWWVELFAAIAVLVFGLVLVFASL